jgi:AcrR family transcriptional regulator
MELTADMESGIQEPLQDRSMQTMNQILDAASELLEERLFEEISIAEIVARAGCSVGAFYGRFKDKSALLFALDEYHFQDFIVAANALIAEIQSEDRGLQEVIRSVVQFLVDAYGRRPGLLRALVLYAKQHHDEGFRLRERRAWALYPQLHQIILNHAAEMDCPDPNFAVRFGFMQVFFTASEILLWGTRNEDFPVSADQLVTELTRTYLAYLGVNP